jgi:hypothetical protein
MPQKNEDMCILVYMSAAKLKMKIEKNKTT